MSMEPRDPIPGSPGHYYHGCPCEPTVERVLGDGSAVVIHEEFAGSDPVDVAAAAHVTAAGRKDATAPPVGLEAHDTTR